MVGVVVCVMFGFLMLVGIYVLFKECVIVG